MAITNFIPTIWSENLLTQLDSQYIGVAHCNRDYDGDITKMGSVVKVCGVGKINVYDYNKVDILNPQDLNETVAEITIDKAKFFNFQIDDIDRAQATPKLMDAAMKVAASSLANAAERAVFDLYDDAGHIVSVPELTPEALFDAILEARQFLFQNNVNDVSDLVLEVTPPVATQILKAKMELSTDNTAVMEKGYLGSIAGCQVYVSNNINVFEIDSKEHIHRCFLRSKRAIAFAEQLSEIEAYRPEKRFSDAVKGLYLFGANVIYPNELVQLEISVTPMGA